MYETSNEYQADLQEDESYNNLFLQGLLADPNTKNEIAEIIKRTIKELKKQDELEQLRILKEKE